MEREFFPQPEMLKPQGPEASFALGRLNTAAASGDAKTIQSLKEELAREFPDQLEMAEAIADFPRYLDVRDQLDAHTKTGKERQQLIREQAEYHFLLTHMVSHVTDRKVLMRFWDSLERMAKAQNKVREYLYGRAGVLSQVATYKIFQKLGHHPELSHPTEDQYNAIDLWEDSGTPMQVKSGKNDQPVFIEVDRMGPTHVAIQGEIGQRRISSQVMRDVERFTTGLSKYEESTGQRVTGHLLVLPKSSYDKVSGEPTEEIVEFVRGHLPNVEKQAA